MNLSKDESIITQVAFKAATDLAVAAGGDINTLLSNFTIAFDVTKDAMFTAHLVSVVGEVMPGAQVIAMSSPQAQPPAPQAYVAPVAASGSLKVAGTQHGPLPAWLEAATAKAGCRKVWDNRDKAEGTKRPWFKQADQPEGAEPAAFWPPRNAA